MPDVMNTMTSLFPLTATIAICIFIAKELIEFGKRRNEKLRKIAAYKVLVAEELLKNAWSIRSMREVLAALQDRFDKVLLEKTFSGSSYIVVERMNGKQSAPLWPFHFSIFDRAVIDLAVLDKDFFESVKATYLALATVKHARTVLMDMCNDDHSLSDHLHSFVDYAVSQMDVAEARIKVTYKDCTGMELDRQKLVSFM
ncbi:hypothetical protein [Pseudomonas sp. NA-150]|uniref:hypothetical protein n=1 Tax=Pseudomonas sp. NA-150 TaxID=3367525 RepID=UPI0037CAC124